MLRPAVLLLVVALHAVLLSLASRWQTRLDRRTEDSLIFLPLPGHVQEPAQSPPTPTPQETPHEKPAPKRDMQLVIVPKELPPAPPSEAPPAPIDWNAEAALAAKHLAQSEPESRPRALDQRGDGLYFDVGPGPEPDAKPEFGWYHARIHRVEALEGGGSLLWLNDRCFIVMAGLIPFPMCGVGKIPPRTDLFDHMRDTPLQYQSGTPP